MVELFPLLRDYLKTLLTVHTAYFFLYKQRQMKKAFAMLCRATAIAAPVLVGVDDLTEPISYPALQRSLRYGQALLSAVLHLVTISLTLSRNGEGVSEGPQKQGTREDREEMDVVQAPDSLQQRRNAHVTAALSLSNILLAAASVALFPNEAAVDKEHSQAWILPTGLLIANAVTLVGAYLLRWDQDDSKRQLGELYGLKYHYKSL